ncbi:MAG: zinc-ribbon domain-containing protein [Ruminococcaceae bacterium]|nr:zinc-ribbon domain-containing protein [Oscillospiraceae bacterium]
MAANYSNNYIFNATIAQLVPLLRDRAFANELNIEMKSENPMPNGVWYRFHHGVSFTSWGEKITITLTPASPATTNVHIKSECGMPTQVIDWGKNKQVVCNVYECMERNIQRFLSYTPPTRPEQIPTPAPPSVAPVTAPVTPKSAPIGKSFCTNCGAQLHPEAIFCGNCGSKQR